MTYMSNLSKSEMATSLTGNCASMGIRERGERYNKVVRNDSQLEIENPYAECYEVKNLDNNNTNELRLYRDAPGTVLLQIRTFEPINESRTGMPRNMIAHLTLTATGVDALIQYLQAHRATL